MVFKLIRGARRIRALEDSVEDEDKLNDYLEKHERMRDVHPLKEDVEIADKYLEYLRFSRPASLYYDQPEKVEHAGMPVRGTTSLPIASVHHLLRNPGRWADRHIILEGEIEHFNTNKRGEHWYRFNDGTGALIAFSRQKMGKVKGTFFGFARQTSVGKQLFLEIRNFHPVEDSGAVE